MSPSQTSPQDLSLQQQAIQKARSAYAHLPNGNALFQQCIAQDDTVAEIMKSVRQKYEFHWRKRCNRILKGFQRYMTWLQNISGIVDVVVQTQAGIGCPVWAPIKFVLQVSNYHAEVAEQILEMIGLMSDNLPRFEIYEKLGKEPALQVALLDIFVDVVELSVKIYQYFKHSSLVRTIKLIMTPLRKDFGDAMQKLKKHAKIVDQTAVATELFKAARFRDKQILRETQCLRQRCEAWLRPSNTNEIHQYQLQKKTPGTCDWIWSHPTFLQWSNTPVDSAASERLLCIHGKHGCGKTVLASSIVEAMRYQGRHILFFSFSGTDASRQTLDGLVRSFLWQIVQGAMSNESLDIVGGLISQGQPLTSNLWDAFNKVAMLVPGSMYWVIDGLDECKEPSRKVLNQILGLLTTHNAARAVFLGRPHIIGSDIPTSFVINIGPSLIKSDIDAFIHSQVHDSVILQSLELRDLVYTTLQDKSNGMFLWVKLMTDDLNKSSSTAELMVRLRELPRDLEQGYRRLVSQLLEKLDKFELKLAQCILSLTIVASHTLRLEELQYAIALEARSRLNASEKRPLQDYLLVDPAQKIIYICGGLVDITDGFVSLVHFSAKEFLTRPEGEWITEDDHKIKGLRIILNDSHRLFSTACLEYIEIGEYGFAIQVPDALGSLWSQYPFLEYASRYLVHHVNRSEFLPSILNEKIQQFLESKASASWVECYAVHFWENGPPDSEIKDLQNLVFRLVQEGHAESLLKIAQTRMDLELFGRKQEFGENDPRTDRWKMICDIITEGISQQTHLEPNVLNTAFTQASYYVSSNPPEMMEILQKSGVLPMQKQIDLLLRLACQLQRAKVLTDPLDLLSRLLLQYAPTIPAHALWAIGYFYSRLKKHEKSLEFYQAAFTRFGDHNVPGKFHVCGCVGVAMAALRRDQEAEHMYRQALEGLTQTLGLNNIDTLNQLNNLGCALWRQKKYVQAEEAFRKVIKWRETELGRYDESTLKGLSELGVVLHEQEKYEEEENVLREQAERNRKAYGPDHVCTLNIAELLASALFHQRKWIEAEEAYRQAACEYQRVFGLKHENTLSSITGIEATLAKQGKAAEGEKVIRQVVKTTEEMFGLAHPLTLDRLSRLGLNLIDQQKHAQAERVFRRVAQEWEKTPALKLEQSLWSVSEVERSLATFEQHSGGDGTDDSYRMELRSLFE